MSDLQAPSYIRNARPASPLDPAWPPAYRTGRTDGRRVDRQVDQAVPQPISERSGNVPRMQPSDEWRRGKIKVRLPLLVLSGIWCRRLVLRFLRVVFGAFEMLAALCGPRVSSEDYRRRQRTCLTQCPNMVSVVSMRRKVVRHYCKACNCPHWPASELGFKNKLAYAGCPVRRYDYPSIFSGASVDAILRDDREHVKILYDDAGVSGSDADGGASALPDRQAGSGDGSVIERENGKDDNGSADK